MKNSATFSGPKAFIQFLSIFLFLFLWSPQTSFAQCPELTITAFATDVDPTDCETQISLVIDIQDIFIIDDLTLQLFYSGLEDLQIECGDDDILVCASDNNDIIISSSDNNIPSSLLPLSITINASFDGSEDCADMALNPDIAYFVSNGNTCPITFNILGELPCQPPSSGTCVQVGYAGSPDCPMTNSDLTAGTTTISTDDNGVACFDIADGGCVDIEIDNCGMCTSELNGLDLVELRKLILGIYVDSPCAFGSLLGDVNNSGGLSTIDLIHIQRHILGLPPLGGSNVGECMLFNPDEVQDGDGLAPSLPATTEVCAGEGDYCSPVTLLAGVSGDFNCSCNCESGEGVGLQDIPTVASIRKNAKQSRVFVRQDLAFYDMALAYDFEGKLDLKQVQLKDFGPGVLAEANIQGNRLFVMINSAKEAIQLEQGSILFDITADVTLSSATVEGMNFLIDAEANGFNMSPSASNREAASSQLTEHTITVFSVEQSITLQANESLQGSTVEIINTAGQQILVKEINEDSKQVLIPVDRKNQILFVRIASKTSSFTKSIFH